MSAHVLTIGEALVDIVHTADGTEMEYPGGSPMNVAVALGRLGHRSDLLTQIGNDDRGERIARHVADSGVALTPGSIETGDRTSTAFAAIDANGAAQYTFDLRWDPVPTGLPERPDAVHTSSIASVLSPGCATVEEVLNRYREQSLISYDPNLRPDMIEDLDAARTRIERLIALAHVVKASDEDLSVLYPDRPIEQSLQALLDAGPDLAVITLGGDGCVGAVRAGSLAVTAPEVRTVDTVGAGDTFSAGLLDALDRRDLLGAAARERRRGLDLEDLESILRHAAIAAAITVSRAGANPPWRAELDERLRT